jgi:hypothetical protein
MQKMMRNNDYVVADCLCHKLRRNLENDRPRCAMNCYVRIFAVDTSRQDGKV